jgi:hypothetical protein
MILSTTSDHVTLVEVLELTGSFAEFASASQALARRLEAEGIAELVAAQFYAAASATEIGGVITFADYRQVIRHITMIAAWDEFRQLLGVARLIDMRVYGPLSAEAEAHLQTMNGLSRRFATPVAGFARWATG